MLGPEEGKDGGLLPSSQFYKAEIQILQVASL